MYKKLLITLIAASFIFTSVYAADFSDMPSADYWSYEALNSAVSDGLLNGSAGKIYPKNNLTRAEMATILVRAYKLTEKADISDYVDVAETAWYYEYMQKACAKGLFRGDESKKLNPELNITRQEVFVVLSRALNISRGKENVLDAFSDKEFVASWAVDATASMIEAGYIKGSGDKLNPLSNITREEFAQIMLNLKKAGALEDKKDDNITGSTTDKKDDNTTSGTTKPSGGTTKPSGGTTKPSTGDKDDGDDETPPFVDDEPEIIIPSTGIDENVDMSDD